MGCCGKGNRTPKISKDEQKLIEVVRKVNYGAIKRGKTRVTLTTRQCFNCNTLVSKSAICPICGHRV